jgi:hypothetical protein
MQSPNETEGSSWMITWHISAALGAEPLPGSASAAVDGVTVARALADSASKVITLFIISSSFGFVHVCATVLPALARLKAMEKS